MRRRPLVVRAPGEVVELRVACLPRDQGALGSLARGLLLSGAVTDELRCLGHGQSFDGGEVVAGRLYLCPPLGGEFPGAARGAIPERLGDAGAVLLRVSGCECLLLLLGIRDALALLDHARVRVGLTTCDGRGPPLNACVRGRGAAPTVASGRLDGPTLAYRGT